MIRRTLRFGAICAALITVLSAPVLAQSQSDIASQISNNLPDNNRGGITAGGLRGVLNSMNAARNQPNGIATLGADGTLLGTQLPVIPPSKGGCGVAALSGLLKGNGTSPCTAAVPGTDFLDPNAGVTGANLDPRAVAEIQVSPKFCPYGQLNGVDSNNACVQSAIDYACSSANSLNGTLIAGKLVFGRFKYKLTGVSIPKACAGLVLAGQGNGGNGGTTIYSDNGCTAPVINFYPDATANYIYGGGLRDMHFFNNVVGGGAFDGSTSCLKPLIQANFGRNMVFEKITSLSPYNLITLVGGLNYTLNDMEANVALPNSPGVWEFYGYGATAAANSATRQDVINAKNLLFFSATPPAGGKYANGIWWHGFSASLRTVNTAFTTTHTALKVDCTAPAVAANLRPTEIGACPQFGRFVNFEAEASGGNAIDMVDAQYMDFWSLYLACYARTSTASPYTSGCNNAMQVGNGQFASTGTVSIVSGVLNGAQASGLYYEGYKLNVSGGLNVYGNNAANVGGANIVIATPPSGKKFGSHAITNAVLCTGPVDNSDGQTGLQVQAGNDWINFSNNILKGCGAGLFAPSGVGTHSATTPNLGP